MSIPTTIHPGRALIMVVVAGLGLSLSLSAAYAKDRVKARRPSQPDRSAVTPPAAPTNRPPTAVIQATPLEGTAPLSVQLDASRSSDPDGTVAAYRWDFGDGSGPADTAAIQHVFQGPGTYTITLTATDNSGQTGQSTQGVLANQAAAMTQPPEELSGVTMSPSQPAMPAVGEQQAGTPVKMPPFGEQPTAPSATPAENVETTIVTGTNISLPPAQPEPTRGHKKPATPAPLPKPAVSPASTGKAIGKAASGAAPTISPPGGTFQGPVDASLHSDTDGAEMHYTFDGSEPHENSARYNGPIRVDHTIVLKARAFAWGAPPSEVASASFTIAPPSPKTQTPAH